MNALHRKTKVLMPIRKNYSYDSGDWLIDPDLSAVEGIDPKYWLVLENSVVAMTTNQMAQVDAAEALIDVNAPSPITSSLAVTSSYSNIAYTVKHPSPPLTEKLTIFGEGIQYEGIDVLVYQGYDDTVTQSRYYPDPSGSMFSSVAAGNEVYVSAQYKSSSYQHTGIEMSIDVPFSSGDIEKYYWNGSYWVEFYTMVSDRDGFKFPHGNDLSGVSGSVNIRYASTICGNNSDWYPTTIGTGESSEPNRYWIKVKIVEELDTLPITSNIKLFSNSMVINPDGFMEYYGKARPVKTMWMDSDHFDKMALYDTNNGLASEDVFFSKIVGIPKVNNTFKKKKDSSVGFDFILPKDIDTSSPICLNLSYVSDTSADADIVFDVSWCLVSNSDSVENASISPQYNYSERVLTKIVPSTGGHTLNFTTFHLTIPDGIAYRKNDHGDILGITITRLGRSSNDTGKDVVLVDVKADYTSWCIGVPA
jgi:hypothetical protein